MRAKIILSLLVITLFSCKKAEINETYGKLISHTSCKNEKDVITTNSESCANYTYNSANKTLQIKHINTSFNCCPDELFCDISIENDTIIIEESEKDAGCDCMCLFDIETEIYNVDAKSYIVKFIEPYIGDQEKLIFEINLNDSTSGSYCVERIDYPWNSRP